MFFAFGMAMDKGDIYLKFFHWFDRLSYFDFIVSEEHWNASDVMRYYLVFLKTPQTLVWLNWFVYS